MTIPTASPQNQSGSSFLVQGCDLSSPSKVTSLSGTRAAWGPDAWLLEGTLQLRSGSTGYDVLTCAKCANAVVKPFVCRAVSGT